MNNTNRFQVIQGNEPLVYGYFTRKELGEAKINIDNDDNTGILPFFVLDRGFQDYICIPNYEVNYNLFVKIHLKFINENLNDDLIIIQVSGVNEFGTARLKIFNQYTLNKFADFMKANENYFRMNIL